MNIIIIPIFLALLIYLKSNVYVIFIFGMLTSLILLFYFKVNSILNSLEIGENVKKDLEKVVFNSKLAIEIYKTFNICVVPLVTVIAFIGGFSLAVPKDKLEKLALKIEALPIPVILAGTILIFVASYFYTLFCANVLYKKHINKLEKNLNQLQ